MNRKKTPSDGKAGGQLPSLLDTDTLFSQDREDLERAYLARDGGMDGRFFAGITTTGIFCKPSCPSRRPRPEHLVFFASAGDAVEAGYRPCKRCSPLEVFDAPPWLGAVLAAIEAEPDRKWPDADIEKFGASAATVRRWFSSHYGMTFQAYSRSRRLLRAFGRVESGESLDSAGLESGWDSFSGFREAFSRYFDHVESVSGVKKEVREAVQDALSASRQQDADPLPGRQVLVDWIETPLGPMVAGVTVAPPSVLIFPCQNVCESEGGEGESSRRWQEPDRDLPDPESGQGESEGPALQAEEKGVESLCFLEFADGRSFAERFRMLGPLLTSPGESPARFMPGQTRLSRRLKLDLEEYFRSGDATFDIPLFMKGSGFTFRTWLALLDIPCGTTLSYAQLAAKVGSPEAVRAVGTANGLNRIAILVPCHRVIGAAGELGGYSGGLWRKRALLDLEARNSPGRGVQPRFQYRR